MMDLEKFRVIVETLKPGATYALNYTNEAEMSEALFDTIDWVTGEDEHSTAITTKTNPHSEITWPLVKAEIDKDQAEYDSQDYARKRQAEYPSIESLVVALYDTEDKTAIDAKRAEIKLKYPKPGA